MILFFADPARPDHDAFLTAYISPFIRASDIKLAQILEVLNLIKIAELVIGGKINISFAVVAILKSEILVHFYGFLSYLFFQCLLQMKNL